MDNLLLGRDVFSGEHFLEFVAEVEADTCLEFVADTCLELLAEVVADICLELLAEVVVDICFDEADELLVEVCVDIFLEEDCEDDIFIVRDVDLDSLA